MKETSMLTSACELRMIGLSLCLLSATVKVHYMFLGSYYHVNISEVRIRQPRSFEY